MLEGQRRFDLILWVGEEFRNDPSKLGKLRLELPGGRGQVPLAERATIEVGAGPNTINRENAKRRIVLRCNALGRDLASVVSDIKDRVGNLQKSGGWPSGYLSLIHIFRFRGLKS